MFQSMVTMVEFGSRQLWMAQVPLDSEIATPEEASLVFSGPQFFTTLIAGVLLAFAFQLVLTNLSLAFGISLLGGDKSSDADSDRDDSGSIGATIRNIGFGLGLWTLITVSLALFVACFLAVQLSLLDSAVLGSITGLVIWAAYFSLLVWVSSTTVGSLIGSVVNSAKSGFQAILGTATAALGAKAVNDQVVATAEAAAAAVRRELTIDIDPVTIRENIEGYIDKLRPAQLDLSGVRGEFEKLLNDPELKSLVGSEGLNVDRQKFVDLVSSRTDLSKREVDRIVDQLEGVWRQTLGQQSPAKPDSVAQLVDYLRSTEPGKINTEEFNTKLDQLTGEVRRLQQGQQGQQGQQQASAGSGPIQQVLQSLNPLIGMVIGRTDLSDLSVEKILGQLKTAQTQVTEQAGQIADQVSSQTGVGDGEPSYGIVRADLENYLLNAYSWQMNQENIARDFRDIIYDPAADPRAIRQQLERINRSDFVNLLNSRGVFTQTRVQEIADQLEGIRQEVLVTARAAEEREAALDLRQRVETYLTVTPKVHLNSEEIQQTFKALLEDAEADHETLTLRLASYNRDTLRQLLIQRQDMSVEEVEAVLDQLEQARDRVLFESQSITEQTQQRTEAAWQNLQGYLRNTGKEELNPDAIKRELQTLLDDPQAGLAALRARVSHFDRDTLVQLLSQRQDISQEQVNSILDQAESAWYRVRYAPQELTGAAKEQYDQVTTKLADYLRSTGKDELNPDGLKRDLSTLLEDPKAGVRALRQRLSQVDRDTLVKLLSQREDLSEEQVNQTIDQVLDSIRGIIKSPRRLATRTQQRVLDFESTIEDYLRNTDKEELDPEGIKRDLQVLVSDPRLGVGNLRDRLSRFDRSTIIALLSQRQDITPEEAERIVGQFESARNKVILQFQEIQYRIEAAIDSIFARIRSYLNSLERPELNYDGIRSDVRTLFDDPQAGFDALRARLGQVDRGTLVALLSSRPDISEADANRIIDQIENTRNSVLQRAERIQTETQRRLEEVKRQAQRQADETRKAAASAAWWLFATAVVSAATSALAGALAVD